MSRKKKIIMISTIVLLIVGLISIGTFALVTVNKGNNKTTTTKKVEEVLSVKSFTNVANTFNIELTSIKDATKYTFEVSDENALVLYNSEVAGPKGEFEIPLNLLTYNKKLFIKSDAYKDDKVIKSLDVPYEFIWEEPSISVLNNPTINNADSYVITIDGVINENNKIVIKSGEQELLNQVLTGNSFEIPANLYKNKTITLNISLLSNDVVVSNFVSNNVYVPKTTTKPKTTKPKNPISDIVITNPKSYVSLADIVDVNVEFTGGEGATSTSIHIYENNNLVKSEVLSAKSYVIPSSMIKKEAGYRVVVEAVNGNFKKSDSVYISTITNGRNKVVELARAQVGNKGDKYWSWWGYNGFVEWCAIFVSWVADQNGYLDAGVIPKFQGVRTGVNWFKERGQFKSRNSGYTPQPGDIIFFDYHPENSLIDHVGIVDYSDGVNVYTIEGNTGKKPNRVCARKTYPINSSKIYGYGVPNY